jgi:hypothetical protein
MGQSTGILTASFSTAGGFIAGDFKSGKVVSPWILLPRDLHQ